MFFYKSFPIFFKKCLTNSFPYCMIVHVPNEYVSVAQLDRASDYGSEGREFESSIARYRDCKEISLQSFCIFGKSHFKGSSPNRRPKIYPKSSKGGAGFKFTYKQLKFAPPDLIQNSIITVPTTLYFENLSACASISALSSK